jgi:hypothetical protein
MNSNEMAKFIGKAVGTRCPRFPIDWLIISSQRADGL